MNALLLAATLTAEQCQTLAQQFATDRASMTIGQLDDLRLCVSDDLAYLIERRRIEIKKAKPAL